MSIILKEVGKITRYSGGMGISTLHVLLAASVLFFGFFVFSGGLTQYPSEFQGDSYQYNLMGRASQPLARNSGGLQFDSLASDEHGSAPVDRSPSQGLTRPQGFDSGAAPKQWLLQSKTGKESIVVGTSPWFDSNKLPNSVMGNYELASYEGYIIKLKQKPLAEKDAELSQEISRYSISAQGPKKLDGATKIKVDQLVAAKRQKIADQKALISNEQQQAEKSIKSIVSSFEVRKKFSKSFNGFSASMSSADAKKLQAAGYKVYPNMQVKAVLMDSVPLVGANDVWKLQDANGNPITGNGTKIAIIDTGVDYTHEDLGGCFGDGLGSGGGGGGSGKQNADGAASCSAFSSQFDQASKKDAIVLTRRIEEASKKLCSSDIQIFSKEIKNLISTRKELLKDLIKTNPGKAALVNDLPSEIKAMLTSSEREQLLEKRGTFNGKIVVLHADDFNKNYSKFIHYLDSGNKRYELFGAGPLPVVSSGTKVNVRGIAVDNYMAVQNGGTALSIEGIPPGSPAEENFGPQRTLVIVAGIGDTPPPVSMEEAENMTFGNQFGSANDYYIKNSFGKASLYGDVVGPYVLSEDEWCQDITMTPLKAAINDADIGNYSRIIVAAPCTYCLCYGGLGTIGKMRDVELPDGKKANFSMSWDFFYDLRVVGHELGHNFGVHHGNLYSCKKPDGFYTQFSYECFSYEYGDPYTIMGSAVQGHHNAPHKKEIGWLSDGNIVATAKGTYLLKPIELIQPSGNIQLIKLPIETETSFFSGKDNVYYTIELRSNEDYDKDLYYNTSVFNGITIRIAEFNEKGEFTYVQSNLLNPKADADIWDGFVLSVGKSFIDSLNGYKITLESVSSEGAKVKIEQIPKVEPDFNKPLVYYNFENITSGGDDKGGTSFFVDDLAGYISDGSAYDAKPMLGGLYFNGNNSFMNVGPDRGYVGNGGAFLTEFMSKNNAFTASAWVNIKGKSIYDVGNILNLYWSETLNYNTFSRTFGTIGEFLDKINSSVYGYISLKSTTKVKQNEWYHVVSVYDGRSLKLYVNGQKESEANSYVYDGKEYPLDNIRFSSSSFIGGFNWGGESINGVIDEVKIFAKALSDNEILSLYTGFVPQEDNGTIDNETITNCKVAGGYDIVNQDNDPMDDHGHGTHVAATAAGNGVLKGVAPDANIYAYKVLTNGGWGYWDWVIEGIERAVDPNQDGDLSDRADVISMSLGGTGDPDDPISQAVDNAVNSGTVVVVAAGNSYSQGTIGSPGVARKALTVGATTKQDEIADFSSRGPVIWKDQSLMKPDIAAPGYKICAAEWDSAWSDRKCLDDIHISISGTSMATPHVAGAAALVKQAHPLWTPEQIKIALKNTAKDIGFSAIDRGTGRLDVLNAVQLKDNFPIARLDPIPTKGGLRVISGVVSSPSLKKWTISYAPLGQENVESNWKILTSSAKIPTSNALFTLNTGLLPDGEFVLRLLVKEINGSRSVDYGYLFVDKFQFVAPLDTDIFRAGDIINVKYNSEVKITKFSLEYQTNNINSPWVKIPTSATWDTTGLGTGWYLLRGTFVHDGISDKEAVWVYLDSALKKGWPQRIEWDKFTCDWDPSQQCSYWAGYLESVVADLENDGAQETIVFKGGNPPMLLAYKPSGKLKWKASVGSTPVAGGNLHIPMVVDLNNNGKKEILAYNYDDEWYGGDPDHSLLFAFDYQGKVVPGWPIKLLGKYWAISILSADLNNDNNHEIILIGHGGKQPLFMIMNSAGEIISQWNLDIPNAWYTGTPAVGNFDSDADLEIAVVATSSFFDNVKQEYVDTVTILVFNSDGSLVSGWPVEMPGIVFSSPSVGDLDNDGYDEIVIGLEYFSDIFPDTRYGGVYVFDNEGKILPGWPVGKGYNYQSSPSLGDLDNDGDLEIAISNLNFQTEVYHHDGQLMPGWPQYTGWVDYYSTVIGDVDGNSQPDIATTAGSYYYGGGGVYAWTSSGTSMPSFPKGTEVDAQAPPVISDLDGNLKTEIVASSDFDYDPINQDYKYRGSLYVWETNSTYKPYTMHWPTFHHDAERTGRYINPVPKKPDLAIIHSKVVQPSQLLKVYNYTITVTNQGTIETGPWEFEVKAGAKLPQYSTQSSLNPGESRKIRGSIKKLPVVFRLDPNKNITEIDENNNNLTVTTVPHKSSVEPVTSSPIIEVEGPVLS